MTEPKHTRWGKGFLSYYINWKTVLTSVVTATALGLTGILWLVVKPLPLLAITQVFATRAELDKMNRQIHEDIKKSDDELKAAFTDALATQSAIQKAQMEKMTAEVSDQVSTKILRFLGDWERRNGRP